MELVVSVIGDSQSYIYKKYNDIVDLKFFYKFLAPRKTDIIDIHILGNFQNIESQIQQKQDRVFLN